MMSFWRLHPKACASANAFWIKLRACGHKAKINKFAPKKSQKPSSVLGGGFFTCVLPVFYLPCTETGGFNHARFFALRCRGVGLCQKSSGVFVFFLVLSALLAGLPGAYIIRLIRAGTFSPLSLFIVFRSLAHLCPPFFPWPKHSGKLWYPHGRK